MKITVLDDHTLHGTLEQHKDPNRFMVVSFVANVSRVRYHAH